MPQPNLPIQHLDAWLRRLIDKWTSASVDVKSKDGAAIYQLVRRGLVEALSRFVAWSPTCDFEVWIEGTLTGRWTKIAAPPEVIAEFSLGQAPRIYQHSYTSFRLSPAPQLAVAEGELKKACAHGGRIEMTPEAVLQLGPIDRPVVFSALPKRVPRVGIFYSRAMFAGGNHLRIPTDSLVRAQMVQGVSPSGAVTAWNVAELEPQGGISEPFASSPAIAFAFTQACFACSNAMFDLMENGRKGDLSATGNDIERELGNACARLHHAGGYVLNLYQRHGRESSHIAAMVADPLSIRNVDLGLLQELDAVAAMDAAVCGKPPKLSKGPVPTDVASADVDREADDGPVGDPEYANIVRMIRHMGRSFETTPSTFTKFDEEELRDLILTHLSGHYHGGAAAERFRKHGKTDVCVAFPSGEAFVCECKVWEGPAECAQALDQLMSYVTTRDRVGAIVFFNKSVKNFTKNVIRASAATLRSNPLFLTQHTMGHFGEHHFEVRHKDDCDRPYHVYVLLFNLYPNPRMMTGTAG